MEEQIAGLVSPNHFVLELTSVVISFQLLTITVLRLLALASVVEHFSNRLLLTPILTTREVR